MQLGSSLLGMNPFKELLEDIFSLISTKKENMGWCEYWFPGATVTTYHKLDSVKQQKFNLSEIWRLEIQNQGVSKDMLSLKA